MKFLLPLFQVLSLKVQLVAFQVEIQVEETSDAEDDQSISQPASEAKAAAAEDMAAAEAEAMPSDGQPAAADANEGAVDTDFNIWESTQAGDKLVGLAEELSERKATGHWPSAAAIDTAVSLSASQHVNPLPALVRTIPKVVASAVSDMPGGKPSAFDSLPQGPDSATAVAKAAPAVPAFTEHGVNGKATPGQPASPSPETMVASHDSGPCLPSPGAKGGSPKSSLAYIPLGKAAMAKQEAEAKLAALKGSSPRACAHAAPAAAGKAAKRGGAKSMLQLNRASRPASRKRPAAALASEHSPVSQASPQPAPQASELPAQSSAKQRASSGAHPSMAHPSSAVTQAASRPADRVSPGGGNAAKSASPQPSQKPESPGAKQTAAKNGHPVIPQLTEVMEQSKPLRTTIVAIKAEQPALSVVPEPRGKAEAPHSTPAPAKVGLPATSRLTGILGKPERPGPKVTAIKADIPAQAAQSHQRAESEEHKLQMEEQRRAEEQRRVLREVGSFTCSAMDWQRTRLPIGCPDLSST